MPLIASTSKKTASCTRHKPTPASRLELLSVIRKEKPKSIQEFSRILKRDFKNVYQDVKALAEFGLYMKKLVAEGGVEPPTPGL